MSPDEIRTCVAHIAGDLHRAGDELAHAHYTVQHLTHELELPAPELLAILGRLAQASQALEDHFHQVARTPRYRDTADRDPEEHGERA